MYILDKRNAGESVLGKRQYYDYDDNCDGYGNNCRTAWNNWGRWVALFAIIFTTFILFFVCALISARRRRRRGLVPIWGTAWVPGPNPPLTHHKHNQWQYDPHASTHQPIDPNPPPVYTPPTGGYYVPPPGSPPGQYEMQSPYFSQQQNTGNREQYNPPPGPPPGVQENGTVSTGEQYAPPNNPPPAHLQGAKI